MIGWMMFKQFRHVSLFGIIGVTALISNGCVSSRPVALDDLDHPDPARQIRAIKWAGDSNQISAISKLIDLLEHDDQARRYYAISALKKITGEDMGYDIKMDAAKRAEAVARWREKYPSVTNQQSAQVPDIDAEGDNQ